MIHKLCFLFVLITFCHLSFSKEGQSSWKKYPYYPEGAALIFPYDEGAHNFIPGLEWWYLVMHVRDIESGEKYSVLVTHFNNSYRFFTVTNIDQQTHLSATVKGALLARPGELDLEQHTPYGVDVLHNKKDPLGANIPFEYELETHHSQMHLKAELKLKKRPMMVGGDGMVEIGSSGESWYYSLTNLEVLGELTYGGKTFGIEGVAWMDHQWGPFLISPVEGNRLFETYEWFCVHLDNNVEMMISNTYDRAYILNTKDPRYGGIQMIDAEGKSTGTLERSFVRNRYWQDPSTGHYMSMGWTVDVPKWDLHLEMTPEFEHQMVDFAAGGSFWEGSIKVAGKYQGIAVKGHSFGELMHRFQIPKIELLNLKDFYKKNQKIQLRWKVLNPDDGNPLNFDVLVKKLNSRFSRFFENLSTDSVIVASETNPLEVGQYEVQVVANSVDKVIQSKATWAFEITD